MKKLDPPVRQRVHEAVQRYARDGQGNVKALQGIDEYRLAGR